MDTTRHARRDKENVLKTREHLHKPRISDDKLHIFANFVIDRILEEQEKGNIHIFAKRKEG